MSSLSPENGWMNGLIQLFKALHTLFKLYYISYPTLDLITVHSSFTFIPGRSTYVTVVSSADDFNNKQENSELSRNIVEGTVLALALSA